MDEMSTGGERQNVIITINLPRLNKNQDKISMGVSLGIGNIPPEPVYFNFRI